MDPYYGSLGQLVSQSSGRRQHKKVRTGCITCKNRKVKCDETKPSCLRCARAGRRCEGYLVGLTRYSSANASLLRTPSLTPELSSPQEYRAFDYYRSFSAPLLGRAVDVDFWAGLVLKVSLQQPAVRHAALAIGNLHECLNVTQLEGREIDRSLAFSEYGKAMQEMRNWDSHSSHMVIPLLVCTMFICIEYLLEHENAAQLHILQGRQILARLEKSRSPAFDIIKQQLVPIFTRLSLASFLFGTRPPPIPDHLRDMVLVPSTFDTIEDARNLLHQLIDEVLRFATTAKPALYEPSTTPEDMQGYAVEQQRLLSEFSKWNIAFTILTTTLPHDQPEHSDLRHLLYVHYHACIVWISTSLHKQEVAYDAHTANFAAVIAHASAFISSPGLSSGQHFFTFETEILAPIYWTVNKCRHPLLRRTALKLLMRREIESRREGLWYSVEDAAVATCIIEHEEEEMPESHRTELPVTRSINGGEHNTTEVDQQAQRHHLETDEGEPRAEGTRPPTIPLHPLDSIDWPVIGQHLGASFPGSKSLDMFQWRRSRDSRDSTPTPVRVGSEDVVNMSPKRFESPFGVPEHKRVKNALIGPRFDGGVWATLFTESKEGSWDVKRELLRL